MVSRRNFISITIMMLTLILMLLRFSEAVTMQVLVYNLEMLTIQGRKQSQDASILRLIIFIPSTLL